jgi:tRNA-Thr(GGU) m(6)t(6)A37 methyltransferase TsaA
MDQAILPVIGVLRTPYTRIEEIPRQSFLAKEVTGRAEVRPEYAPGLRDIAPGDRLELYFLFHGGEGWRPVVRTRRSGQEKGVFATRSPDRPSRLGVSQVEVVRVEEGAIVFAGVDMLDGSPLLDIKPGFEE